MEVHGGAEIHLQPIYGGAEIHLQPLEDPTRASGCLKVAVTLWEAHCGAGSCQDLWTCEERSPHWSRFAGWTCDPVGDPLWSSLFQKACTLCEEPTLEQFVKNCSPWDEVMLEEFKEDCLPWEGLHAGA
ncbi:hypothetical protein TURU_085957 [Turdus rufiventris]|nr:hypothetical protein TURU_085957 [Turdus rufiventris]